MANKPVALVTGANQGIGLQIAKDLVPHGFTVLVGSRNFEKGQTAAKSIGADAHAVQLDVTDHESIAAAAERIRKEFGRLDVLIQNAAISNKSRKNATVAAQIPTQFACPFAGVTQTVTKPQIRKSWIAE